MGRGGEKETEKGGKKELKAWSYSKKSYLQLGPWRRGWASWLTDKESKVEGLCNYHWRMAPTHSCCWEGTMMTQSLGRCWILPIPRPHAVLLSGRAGDVSELIRFLSLLVPCVALIELPYCADTSGVWFGPSIQTRRQPLFKAVWSKMGWGVPHLAISQTNQAEL